MLPALGAVSAALEAFKSLTTKPSSSGPNGFSVAVAKPSGNSTPASGVSSISPENISTLLKAQTQSRGSDANSHLQDVSTTFSKDASVAYSAINQLVHRQTTAFQLPSGTLSINV